MPLSLQNAKYFASGNVCNQRNDRLFKSLYITNMVKKSRPVLQVRWYLREWMDALQVRQSFMVEQAGWSKTTASLLYNCQQDYNPDLVDQAARALKIATYELLMPPAEAMAIRRLRDSALTIAAETLNEYRAAPKEFTVLAR